ncbi:hypothetical protein SAMN04488548_12720 [Gordonia westfalica]|uniref:Uncharacterized protein n=1 Tax=Gordonia westfalica TaxID=158898 RepID=A0A1H2DQW5_9ACTN|nr:hypothetical protein SAMN04488548_10124 [Gordonia westfalica]SDT83729.1 hypothetical protein SAMN04488548_10149 [Gordonia westfalica]SDT85283.1 hypothetical protein SAMN04488548_11828 [Gordonia westfalica]SDT85530.1 hypothetical protein SAMN04488548_12012 [Gordonia westfalica]SDT85546.1 hypothetical protein SAMN04488548_12017 [Gordonia westfalica]
MSRPICGVCGFDLGYGHMVRMRWGDRTGDIIPCPNCLAHHDAQDILRRYTHE